jgi:hypothetical protein
MVRLENCPEYHTTSNSVYYYALNILINIALLKFDKAALITDIVIKEKKDHVKWYIIYLLKYYLQIHKLLNFGTGDENAIIDFIVTYTNYIFEDIEKDCKK